MNALLRLLLIIATSLAYSACSSDEEPVIPTPNPVPELTLGSASVVEVDGGATLQFSIKASAPVSDNAVTFDYVIEGQTAEPGVDFTASSGSGSLGIGSTEATVDVAVLNDDFREVDEYIKLTVSNVKNATITTPTIIGTITDNDATVTTDAEGVISPTEYFGFNLLWGDEYTSDVLNEEDYNYELGDGCPNLCGWGNQELQLYTNIPKNIKLEDGKMIITATQEGSTYESARITTKDKVEFRFGRIDIRAKLPEGQGLWPALWMLGANIDDVGWPACGEIDIMEIVGDKPTRLLGTAHWGEPGAGSTFRTGTYTNNTKFSEGFHVFTMVWELNTLTWYIDNVKFHTIRSSEISPAQWRFNQNFFMIFNVAIGGLLPGNPDETTMFPQTMEIDYVRVFQPVQ